jgi:hypothetical protein
MNRRMKCTRCQDTYWVCETHDDRPWSGDKACGCGGAGMPCPSCNVSNPDNPPRLPAGFQRDESLMTNESYLLCILQLPTGHPDCRAISSRSMQKSKEHM